jgi:hypothetical protein
VSSVLRSERAARVNVEIMRAFVQLRKMTASNRELAQRLDELEQRYDAQIEVVIDAIRVLMAPPAQPRRNMGFRSGNEQYGGIVWTCLTGYSTSITGRWMSCSGSAKG